MHYIKLVAKCLGFGFLVYHSDSQKYFYSLTRKDALEWLGATYADAAIFSNWTKKTVTIKFSKAWFSRVFQGIIKPYILGANMLLISKTYEIITEESAENGDAEERGFLLEKFPLRISRSSKLFGGRVTVTKPNH